MGINLTGKKFLYHSQTNSKEITKPKIKLIHQIFDTINISLIVLILILFTLSFESQSKWTNTYINLAKTKKINNNLVDYIAKIEKFFISEIETINTYKKTKPEDLIYLDKFTEKKEDLFKKNIRGFIEGIHDSKYQRGY